MSSVKILHCADLHIGAAESFLGQDAPKRQFETLMTFERIVDLAAAHSVQVLLIAGDLFDSNRVGEELVDPVFKKIASVPQIRVVFAAGNHDPLGADSPFRNRELPDNLIVMDTKDSCVELQGLPVRVYGKSFESVYLKGEPEFSIKPPEDDVINLMVLHGELTTDIQSRYNAVTPQFVAGSHMDYIALGHVHKRTEIAKLSSTFFAYSGCPEGQGFDELDEKGVYIGTVTKEGSEMTFVPTAKRLHIVKTIDVTGLQNTAEITDRILESLRQEETDFSENLYKIILTGNLSEQVSCNLTEVQSRVLETVYFAKVIDRTEPEADYEKIAQEISLKGLFVKKILEQAENADEEEKARFKQALKIGLAAFRSEVEYREDT